MDNLSRGDIVQLLNFYKNKSSDLEFQYLILQINSKKELEEKTKNIENDLNAKIDSINKKSNEEILLLRDAILEHEKKTKPKTKTKTIK
jgi:hypothetical protein